MPDKEIKINGYNMTPMVNGKNYKMAREFAQLVQTYIKKHTLNGNEPNFSNSLPEELKRFTYSSISNTNQAENQSTSNNNLPNKNDATWVPERAGEVESKSSNSNSNTNNNPNSRFKVGIEWDKNKKLKGNVK